MGMKTGLVIGFGAGYVLGAKAGRGRYEQIMHWMERLADSDVADVTKTIAGSGAAAALGNLRKLRG